MDDPKTLLLIPGVIYGVGLAELIKAFRPKVYWEISVMASIMILTLIINWFLFSSRLSVVSENLGLFALTLITPMLFTRACSILSPDAGTQDTRAHYLEKIKPFFLLLAIHTSVNVIIQLLIQDDGFNILRYVIIPFLFASAFVHRLWLRIITMVIILGTFMYIFIGHQPGF